MVLGLRTKPFKGVAFPFNPCDLFFSFFFSPVVAAVFVYCVFGLLSSFSGLEICTLDLVTA